MNNTPLHLIRFLNEDWEGHTSEERKALRKSNDRYGIHPKDDPSERLDPNSEDAEDYMDYYTSRARYRLPKGARKGMPIGQFAIDPNVQSDLTPMQNAMWDSFGTERKELADKLDELIRSAHEAKEALENKRFGEYNDDRYDFTKFESLGKKIDELIGEVGEPISRYMDDLEDQGIDARKKRAHEDFLKTIRKM